jgi:hypothetical protein
MYNGRFSIDKNKLKKGAIITACKLFIVKFMVVRKGKSGVVSIKSAETFTLHFPIIRSCRKSFTVGV